MDKCICNNKTVIGRDVDVDFLEFKGGITVRAKVDTGAYTGGLHAEDIVEEDGELSFRPLSAQNEKVTVKKFRKKWVKPTTGEKHTRYVITTKVKIADIERTLELTLADRSKMKYDMLIGRKNLAKKFIVDVSK